MNSSSAGWPRFVPQDPTTPASQFAHRILVEYADGRAQVIGTATVICRGLCLTAKHNIEWILREHGADRAVGGNAAEISGYSVRLYEVRPGPQYIVWEVVRAWLAPDTDLALLHTKISAYSDDPPRQFGALRFRAVPPEPGALVHAFGYHKSEVVTRPAESGGYHMEINDEPAAASGRVVSIYPSGRDRALYCFPCFETDVRFEAGMSGGPVFDAAGSVCGIVCGSMPCGDDSPAGTSYVSTIWPMLRFKINVDRGPSFPRGVTYQLTELIDNGILNMTHLQEVCEADFPAPPPPTS